MCLRLLVYFWSSLSSLSSPFFFFFNDTATTEIYTLSLHDALPICLRHGTSDQRGAPGAPRQRPRRQPRPKRDRKSTRLNSSHLVISYAVFCLKKKKTNKKSPRRQADTGLVQQRLT